MSDNAQGGNDNFVFAPSNGHNVIQDFGQGISKIPGSNLGTDHIGVIALGITSFSQLNISAFDPITHTSTISFSADNDVVVHSQVALTQHDFFLA